MNANPASRLRVLVARAVFASVIERLATHFQVESNPADEIWSRAELTRRLQGCAGLFATGSERVDDELLAACPDLRAVCNMAVGYNNIDVDACTARGVVVLPAPLPPSSATTPPSGTCSDTPFSTRITWL